MKSAKLRTWTDVPDLTAEGKSGQQGEKHPKVRDISRLIVLAILPAVALAIVALSRPGGGDDNGRTEGIAVRANRALSAVTPTETEGAVGAELALAVRVSGPRGAPVQNNLVSWRLVGGGGGVLSADSVLTNENGEALNTLRLPQEPGRVMVVVKAATAEPPQVGFFIDVVLPQPRRIRAVLGGGQTAPAGALLPEPLTVQVTDTKGLAVPDIAVRFHVASGDGTLDPEVVFTDATGEASTQWTLGPEVGSQTVTAHVQAAGDTVFDFMANAIQSTTLEPAVSPEPATPTESVPTSESGPTESVTTPEPRPRRLGLAEGDGQSAPVGAALPEPLKVRVTDADGAGVPDLAVQFRVTSGGGTLGQRVVFTDSEGRASTRWTLGPTAGTQEVSARVQAAVDTVFEFTANALEAVERSETARPAEPVTSPEPVTPTESEASEPPAAVAVPPVRRVGSAVGDGQSAPVGEILPEPLEVRVTDADGSPVSDVAVVFRVSSGGGSLGQRVVFTDSDGRASTRWTLGPAAGPQEVSARVQAAGDTVFDFTANALAAVEPAESATPSEPEAALPPVRRLGSILGNDQRAPAGKALPEPLEVRVTDADGSPVPDVAVLFGVSSGGGALSRRVVFTDSDGRASTRWTLGPAAGRQEVNARIQAAGDTVFEFVASALKAVAPPEPAATTTRRGVAPPQRRVGTTLGGGQSAPTGRVLPEPLEVRVTDARGVAVPDVVVRFQVSSGGGTVGREVVFTDSLGRASTRWTLGPVAGPQEVTARVPAAGDTVFGFRANALELVAPPESVAEAAVEEQNENPENEKNGIPTQEPDTAQAEQTSSSEPATTAAAERATEASRPAARPESTVPARTETPQPAARRPVAASLPVLRSIHTVGGEHVCVLTGGAPYCRGANERGQLAGEAASGLFALAAGLAHTCGVDETGAATCWGANDHGQLGDGSTTDRFEARAVEGGFRFATLAAGAAHTCGLSRSGEVFCWGSNINGQLGDGSRDDRHQPRPVASTGGFRTVAAGWNHTCAVDAKGEAYCWGLNGEGQIGDGSRLDRLAPVRVPGGFSSLVAGASHTCGVSGGRILCWGDNSFGQLGDGTNEDHTRPVAVEGSLGRVIRLAAGAMHTCALLEDGAVYCWGQNRRGELGDGTTENRNVPTRVATDATFRSIDAGGAVTCGFSTDWTEYCWGQNRSGQLGDGTRTSRPMPTRSPGS